VGLGIVGPGIVGLRIGGFDIGDTVGFHRGLHSKGLPNTSKVPSTTPICRPDTACVGVAPAYGIAFAYPYRLLLQG
jgi:hypothetical protein